MERIGPYELHAEIARGAMGVVYRAQRGERTVALKVLLAGARGDAELLERFQAEARTLAKLKHPGVVSVLDAGTDRGRFYLVMELVVGESLQARLKRKGRLSAAETARLGRALALALDHAHAAGVVHRDLKPANVLLNQHGEPVLIDFGLARVGQGHLTATGDLLGSPLYMAPEQAGGDRGRIGPATDVYGLGALLYRCLAGRPPFASTTLEDVLHAILHLDPEPLRPRCPDASPELIALVERCLAKEPTERPQAAELARALAVVDDRGAVAGSTRRWPWLALGLVAVLVSVGVGAWAASRTPSRAVASPGPASPADPAPSTSPATPASPDPTAPTPSATPVSTSPSDRAREALQEVRRLRAVREFEAAVERADAILAVHPDWDAALALRALAATDAGRTSRPTAELRRVAARDSQAPDVLIVRAVVAILDREPPERIAALLDRVERQPERVLVRDLEVSQLWGALRRGDRSRALLDRCYSRSETPDELDLIASVATQHQSFELAIEAATRSIALDPSRARPYFHRGTALNISGRSSAALVDFDRAIELDPDNWVAYMHRGIVKRDLRDHEGCLADFERAAALNPVEDPTLHGNLGQLYLQRGQPGDQQRALAAFTRARDLSPIGGPQRAELERAIEYLQRQR